jgi:ankyrin repeat protein
MYGCCEGLAFSPVNARGHLGNLLHDAAQAWDIERVRLLLSFGAEVNARNFEGGHTPLYYAATAPVPISRSQPPRYGSA